MRKTRDLFKKIRDTKGIFHANIDTIKDSNCMDLKEVEDIKKRWQEYTEELYKKYLRDPDNHHGVITHLDTGIWNFVVQVLLKPGLENFEHYFTSMWHECNHAVV